MLQWTRKQPLRFSKNFYKPRKPGKPTETQTGKREFLYENEEVLTMDLKTGWAKLSRARISAAQLPKIASSGAWESWLVKKIHLTYEEMVAVQNDHLNGNGMQQ
jgi:hypothetical protein